MMNMIRMMTIALPMTLLLACGGGGGNAATTSPAETSETRYPNEPAFLPGYAIGNVESARNHISGAVAPTGITDETQIVSAIRTRATAANTFKFSHFEGTNVDNNCPTNSLCSRFLPGAGTLTFSLAGIEDLSLANDGELRGFSSESRAVMTTNNGSVTMIESRSAGRHRNGAQLSFQTYGGWLTNSVFGVELLGVREGATTTPHFASFSFGKASGSDPTGTAQVANWNGVMVGVDMGTRDIVQGDATISVNLYQTSSSGNILFSGIKNLNTGGDVSNIAADFSWTRGAFDSNRFVNRQGITGFTMLEGSFYGDNNEEIGGIFRTQNNILGAFGARR